MAGASAAALIGCLRYPDIAIGSVGTPYTDAVDATMFTATGLPSVGASQRGVIAIGGRSGTTRTITSVTIGGQAASLLHKVDNAGTTVALYIGPVGASGDVVVTLDGNWARAVIAVWPCSNIQSATPTDTGGSIAVPMSDTIDCVAGGAVFGISHNAAVGDYTWTGLTEWFDASPEVGAQISGASTSFAVAQTGLTVTADVASESAQAMALAALR